MTVIAPPVCDDAPIWDVWLAAFHAPTLAIADELGLFAIVDERSATCPELATRLNVELRAVEAITGLMTSLGFLIRADGRYCLTDTARHYLLPASPYYWGPLLRRIREIPLDCAKLLDSLRRGRTAADARVTNMWQAPRVPPQALIGFTHAMHAHSFALAMRTVSSFGFSGASRVLDVAGGSGSYSIAAALHHPGIQCTVLELPTVCDVAREYVEKLGAASSVAFVPADMFVDPWPAGHDRVFFSDIFHDWDDERCRVLARRAYEALEPGGRILVHEMILADSMDGPRAAVAYSMVMIFVAEGRQRTARELSEILTSAGFAHVEVSTTSGGYALLSGTKP